MSQHVFYRENRQAWEEENIRLSERFQEDGATMEWRIHPMSQRENEEIWRRSGGEMEKYEHLLLAASVVHPDLKDMELQNSYGAFGAEHLLMQMLMPGEYACLYREVERINGKEKEGEDCIDSI